MYRKTLMLIIALICATVLLFIPFTANAGSNGSISGKASAAGTGTAIQGMYVEAMPVDSSGNFDPARSGTYKTFTSSAGAYTIGGLPPGSYKVIINAALAQNDNARQYIFQLYNGKPTWDAADIVEVEDGVATNNVDVSMYVGGRVTGRVTGAPAATVFAIPVLNSGLLDINRYMRQASIDASGNYTVVGLASGYYKVQAYQIGYADVYYNNKTAFETADKVFVGAPNTVPGIDFTMVVGESGGGPGGGAGEDGPVGGGGAGGGGGGGGGGADPGDKPPAPTGLKASYKEGKVTLTWNSVTATGLTGYNIYRAEDIKAAGAKLNPSVAAAATYVDGTVEGLKTYYYYVTAVAGGSLESDPSARVELVIDELLEPVTFKDVGREHWAYTFIGRLAALKIVSGYSDGTFRPGNSVTRAEFAKMIVVASGWPLAAPASPSFKDVPASHWAYAYIETAKEHGVISGYPGGVFKPSNNIKRAEICAMVVRSQAYPVDKSGTAFSDINSSHWAYEMVMTAKNKSIVGGYPGGVFKPDGLASRAEASKMIYSVIQ
ncbi:MAG: S-layer homology domain-containing protein [Candidatus Aquicultor sp.]|nr:S-layer homology domain-containing protein [Candidatus Aquicultor sp.]